MYHDLLNWAIDSSKDEKDILPFMDEILKHKEFPPEFLMECYLDLCDNPDLRKRK